jgi:predicted branched-subunit amino acid permease
MTSKHAEFLAGIKDILPILMGVIPFGLIYGVSARGAGIVAPAAQAMSFIVFAGSAQFVTAQLIGAAVPGGIIILTRSSSIYAMPYTVPRSLPISSDCTRSGNCSWHIC